MADNPQESASNMEGTGTLAAFFAGCLTATAALTSWPMWLRIILFVCAFFMHAVGIKAAHRRTDLLISTLRREIGAALFADEVRP